MAHPIAIIVTGLPGSGKTTLATRLAADLRLPLLSKDLIKEALFDTLGCGDLLWSQQLGRASIAVLYAMIEAQLKAARSCVVECAFHAAHANAELGALAARYPVEFIQIYCTTACEVLAERIRARAANGARHPGHHDLLTVAEVEALARRKTIDALDLDGLRLDVDTTDWGGVDYDGLRRAVADRLEAACASR